MRLTGGVVADVVDRIGWGLGRGAGEAWAFPWGRGAAMHCARWQGWGSQAGSERGPPAKGRSAADCKDGGGGRAGGGSVSEGRSRQESAQDGRGLSLEAGTDSVAFRIQNKRGP